MTTASDFCRLCRCLELASSDLADPSPWHERRCALHLQEAQQAIDSMLMKCVRPVRRVA